MSERAFIVPRNEEAEEAVAQAAHHPILFDALLVGDTVDLGSGPQAVRHVVIKDGNRSYEVARPSGRTPLQTVSHAAVERHAQERYDLERGGYGGKVAAMAAVLGMVGRKA